jgi:hypothetical protein
MDRSVHEARWIFAPVFGIGVVFVAVAILFG